MKPFFYQMTQNIAGSFRGKFIFFHLIAIFLTALLVLSGFDWKYFEMIHGSRISSFLVPAIGFGSLVPILLPLVFFACAQIRKSEKFLNTGYALAQSAFLGLAISSFYKAFTGRIPPMHHMVAVTSDISREFQFGFMRGGIFWGWPSSHTTVAFATMTALIVLYPKNSLLRLIALCYACYVGFGVSVGIHWFSEFVAGAIIGAAIGTVVGRSFSKRLTSANPA